jgi:hypothetical protein
MIDLTQLTTQELEGLMAQVRQELASRRADTSALINWSHPCSEASQYHNAKYRHWAKLVKSVDTTKSTGYAFDGEFLRVRQQHKVPVGGIIVWTCDKTLVASRITAEGPVTVAEGTYAQMADFIDAVAAVMDEEA